MFRVFFILIYIQPLYCNFECNHGTVRVCDCHRIIDDRMEKYGSLFVFISKQHCHATLKNLLATGGQGEQQTADCAGVGWLRNHETQNFDKIILNFAKFEENFAKLRKQKFCSHPMQEWSEGGGRPVQPCRILQVMQIVHYLSFYYTVFHSVIYNSVVINFECRFET